MSESLVAAKKQKLNDGSTFVTQVIDLETNTGSSIAKVETSNRKNNLQYSRNKSIITMIRYIQ